MSVKHKAIRKVKVVVAKAVKAAEQAASSMDSPNPASHMELPWMKYVAMLTGVLAAVAGFLTVQTTMLTNEAIYESNQAILSQTQASDAWAEYQANSVKARVVETQLAVASRITPSEHTELTKADSELREAQPGFKQTAEAREKARDEHLGQGMKRLGEKDELGYAGMAVQLGIALASVAALTRRRTMLVIGAVVGISGLLIAGYALGMSYLAGQ